jgi:hypothetical protein
VVDYPDGQQVTLTATSTAGGFRGWSDVRCPAGPMCTLTLDDAATTLAASFSRQRVWVRVAGAGTVGTSAGPCVVVPDPADRTDQRTRDCGVAPPPVEPRPHGDAGRRDHRSQMAAGVGRSCAPAVRRRRGNGGHRRADLSDRGEQPQLGQRRLRRPAVRRGRRVDRDRRFRVLKVGSESGTIRSDSLDCGNRCTVEKVFGNRERLVADAGRGSEFVRWRGACSTTPTCALAVGPVTAIAAEFRAADGASQASRRPSTGTPGTRGLVARGGRISVRGAGAAG